VGDVVIDTNVLVSGLLRAKGPPGRILDLILTGELHPVFDDRILLEYRRVLSRPRFDFRPQDVWDLLEYLRYSGWHLVAPPLAVTLPDPDDLPFLEVAVAAQAPLITGNFRHFPRPAIHKTGVRLFSPARFLEQLA
jgi:putative PIN family toxin of toxin-antitoxin system